MVTVHTSTTVIEPSSSADLRSGNSGAQLELIYKDVAKELAKEFSNAVLHEIKLVWEDVQRQYRDHNRLLARQEWIVQELQACLLKQGGGRAQQASLPSSETEQKVGRENSINTDQVITPRVQGQTQDCFCNFETPRAIKDVSKVKRIPQGVTEMETWVADRIVLSRMSPRPCEPPKPPVSDPHGIMPDVEGEASTPVGEQHVVVFPSPGETRGLQGGSERKRTMVSVRSKTTAFGLSDAQASRLVGGSTVPGDIAEDGDDNNEDSRAGKRQSVKKVERLFGDMGVDKSNLDQEEYKVEKYYFESGICQFIAKNEIFSHITLAVIGANAIYIGVDADNNPAENLANADVGFQICEHAFCVFFTFEWLMRFGAFSNKCNCLRDMWFKFDTALVLMMVIETWILPIAFAGSGGTGIPTGLVKMLRLLRLARMARLMRSFPELVAMIKGVKQASRAVGSALLLLVGLVYVFAIIMFTLLKEEKDETVKERFGRLGTVMVTLITDGAFMDGIGYVSRTLLATNNYFAECIFMIFVLLSALTVMNMLIGVLCEVVSAVASAEKEDGQIRLVKDRLLVMLRELDEDGSGMISREEIDQVLDNHSALDVLRSLEVDVQSLMEELNLCYESADDLTIHQIMDLILMLRGDRSLTMKDLKHAHDFTIWKMGKAYSALDSSPSTTALPASEAADIRGSSKMSEEKREDILRFSESNALQQPTGLPLSPPVQEPSRVAQAEVPRTP